VDGPGTEAVELDGTDVVGTGGVSVDDVTPVDSEIPGPGELEEDPPPPLVLGLGESMVEEEHTGEVVDGSES
jgi:hypothetical protein